MPEWIGSISSLQSLREQLLRDILNIVQIEILARHSAHVKAGNVSLMFFDTDKIRTVVKLPAAPPF